MIKAHNINKGEAQTVALQVIGWIVSEPRRSERFLGLTGLDADQLRDGLGDGSILGAAIDFLLTHEPDLVACAEHIGVTPAAIVASREAIG